VLGVLPLGNSVWLLVIIGSLMMLAVIFLLIATIYNMQDAADKQNDYDDFGPEDERDWHNHVHVLHPYKPPIYDWKPNFYDWEKDD
jgi:hypothetical protein